MTWNKERGGVVGAFGLLMRPRMWGQVVWTTCRPSGLCGCCQGSSGPIRTARPSSVLWWAVSYWATGIFFTKMFPEWKAFQFITGCQLSRTQGNLMYVFILQNSTAVLTMACTVPKLCCFFIIVGIVRGKSFYSSGFRGKGKGPGVDPNPRSSVKLCGS